MMVLLLEESLTLCYCSSDLIVLAGKAGSETIDLA